MLLFVSADFFRRRRRPPRPTDDVPTREFFNLLAFWALLAIGSFCAAVAVFAGIAVVSFDVAVDYRILIALAVCAVVCINRAFVYWWRMRG
jgi:hypothetical protein